MSVLERLVVMELAIWPASCMTESVLLGTTGVALNIVLGALDAGVLRRTPLSDGEAAAPTDAPAPAATLGAGAAAAGGAGADEEEEELGM